MPNTYDEFLSQLATLHRLGGIMGLLSWDQEVTMPSGAARTRANQRAALATVIHAKLVAPELGTLLDDLGDGRELDATARANLRETRRVRDRAVRLPAALVTELAQTAALAQGEWIQAREQDDWERFAPHLEHLVALKRREAAALGIGAEPYDALLDEFEPGARCAAILPVFNRLRAALSDLLARIDATIQGPPLAGSFPLDRQEALCRRVLGLMGFDSDKGRLDRSTHPFTESLGRGDIRLTTRYDESDLLSGLSSVMHEAGHALYEQGLPAECAEAPAGQATSLGIHESQSRLWENHVGRSLPFCRWLAPVLRETFPERLAELDAAALYRAVNIVRPSPIRTEADEVTYNLHIVLRLEIERALINGEIETADVPGSWRRLAAEYLGLELVDHRRGALQDIHWSTGSFGYFPTYTLGNLYAAMFWSEASATLTGLDGQLAAGDFQPLLTWLREHIHRRGSILTAGELCREVTGHDLHAEPFVAYLENKFGTLYEL